MALIVWGKGRSANVQKVLWCLAEMGAAYEHRQDGIAMGATCDSPSDTAYFAQKQAPLRPMIEDDGFLLWEGNAIVRYLADKHGKPPFWPESLQGRHDAGRWMDYQLSTIRGNIHPLLRESGDAEEREGYLRKLSRAMDVLERRLGAVDYLCGKDFTAGDIPLGITTYRWLLLDVPRPSFPNVEAWCRRLQSRPAFQKTVHPPLDSSTPLRDVV